MFAGRSAFRHGDPIAPKPSAHETLQPQISAHRLRRCHGACCGPRPRATAPCAGGAEVGARAIAAHGRPRRRDRRRRRRRHCRGAPPDCGRTAGRCAGGGGRGRRPLPDRQLNLRRRLRPRRPCALLARHQSGGEARDPKRPRYLSRSARPAHPHRPALRARGRDGGTAGRYRAGQSRHRRRRAPRRRFRRADPAQGSRRLARHHRVHARALSMRQGSGRGLGG